MFNKRQRFSIRKLSVGVASVLVGLMSISAMAPVSAQEAAAEAEIAPATEEAGDVVGESEEVYLPSGASTDPDNNDQSGKDQDSKPVDQDTTFEDNLDEDGYDRYNKPARDDIGELTIADTIILNKPVLTEVEDLNNLTDEEGERVVLAFINANSSVITTQIARVLLYDGKIYVQFVDDSEVILEPAVVQKGTKIETIAENTTPQSTVVEGIADLKAITQEEKDAIKASIEAGNPVVPAGLEYGFEEDGELTLFYSEEAMKTIIEAVKKANPNLPEGTEIVVDYNGDVIVVYSDGSEDILTIETLLLPTTEETTTEETTVAETTVEEVVAEKEAPAPVAEKAELPNTGTASSIVSLGASATAMLLGLGVLKRKED